MPYDKVANKISKAKPKLEKLIPLVRQSKQTPVIPNKTPAIFSNFILSLKKRMAISTTNTGVNEFKMLASELSILEIAMEYKKAGRRLPVTPDKMTTRNFFAGSLAR